MKDKISDKDSGMAEDLIFGLKNLEGLVDHANTFYGITKEKKFQELADIGRKVRTRWMELIVKDQKNWCCTKHLLASSMSLLEVANRFNSMGDKEMCAKALDDSLILTSLVLLINGIEGGEVKSEA
jgi:hypothetical protein